MITALMLTLSGCLFRPPDELYTRPEKSVGYDQLAASIQAVRAQMQDELGAKCEDALIVSGDNTATIQLQDLDSDGHRESALAFFRIPGVEKSLRIVIFTQVGENYLVTGMVEGDGAAIYSVDYVDLDGAGFKELVVNWQVSAGVYQLGAYTLDELNIPTDATEQPGEHHPYAAERASLLATELLLTSCSAVSEGTGSYSSGYRLIDINQDTRMEIAVVRVNSAGVDSHVEVYGWQNGQLESVGSAELSSGIAAVTKVRANYLNGEYYPPALYLSSTLNDGSRVVDVLAYQLVESGGRVKQLVNLSLDPGAEVSRNCVQGYTDVSPADINGDLVLELPAPTPLPVLADMPSSNFWLIDWSQYDEAGQCNYVMTTYHNVSDGWYLEIPESWREKIIISRNDALSGQRQVIFSLWQGEDEPPVPFLSIYRLTGSNRASRAEEDGRFILREEGEVIYAARFYEVSWNCGVTENDLLMKNFQTIQTSWYN